MSNCIILSASNHVVLYATWTDTLCVRAYVQPSCVIDIVQSVTSVAQRHYGGRIGLLCKTESMKTSKGEKCCKKNRMFLVNSLFLNLQTLDS